MKSRDYLAIFRRGWYVIVIAILLGGGVAAGLSQLATPTYSAQSSIYFSISYGNTANDLNQGSSYAQSQMLSFAVLATTPAVLEPVIDDLGLDTPVGSLQNHIDVSNPQSTVILNVTVTNTSADKAAEIANGVADSLSDTVEQMAPQTDSKTNAVIAKVVTRAVPPERPASPNTRINLIAGLLIGLIGGALLALLRETIDTRVRNAAAVERMTTLPVIGSIDRNAGGDDGVLLLRDPSSPSAEAFRQLRANLQFVTVDEDESTVILITSSHQSEGKSIVATNLAVAIAETGSRVVLVDADLRRPKVAALTGLEGAAGLTTAVIGRATLDEVVQPGPHEFLDVLTAGAIPPNPAELLSSRAMSSLLDSLRASYDIVIIDSAPVLPVADALVLARSASAVVVVADTRRVRRAQLAATLDALSQSGGHVAGLVLNRLKAGRDRRAYYHAHDEQASSSSRLRSRSAGSNRPRPATTIDETDDFATPATATATATLPAPGANDRRDAELDFELPDADRAGDEGHDDLDEDQLEPADDAASNASRRASRRGVRRQK